MTKNLVLFILFSLLMIGCNSEKKNRTEYEKYYDINLSRCKEAIMVNGIDSVSAEKVCDCILEKAYNIDPSFPTMDNNEFQLFLSENLEEIRNACGEELMNGYQ